MKKLFAILLSVMMLIGLLPLSAFAAEDEDILIMPNDILIMPNDILTPNSGTAEAPAWYDAAVQFCLDNGLMKDFKTGPFKPAGTINRAEIAAMLWRLDGSPKTDITTAFYGDMTADDWYAEAVSWAYNNGIFNGVEPHVFAGEKAISRQQLVTVLYRYAQYKGEGFTGSWMFLLDFNDRAEIASYANEAAHWCSMKGIVKGNASGNFNPKGNATRAAACAMIQRLSDALAK